MAQHREDASLTGQQHRYDHRVLGSKERTAFQPPAQPSASDWEAPDFEEFDLCMEVTAYVQFWQ